MSINSSYTKKTSDTFFVLLIYLTTLCYSQEKSAFNSDEINSLISYVQNKDNFNYNFSLELFFIGLVTSIIYLTFEGILQANKLFKNIDIA